MTRYSPEPSACCMTHAHIGRQAGGLVQQGPKGLSGLEAPRTLFCSVTHAPMRPAQQVGLMAHRQGAGGLCQGGVPLEALRLPVERRHDCHGVRAGHGPHQRACAQPAHAVCVARHEPRVVTIPCRVSSTQGASMPPERWPGKDEMEHAGHSAGPNPLAAKVVP